MNKGDILLPLAASPACLAPFHDAPPQPAPTGRPISRHRENGVTPVQPAPAGFEAHVLRCFCGRDYYEDRDSRCVELRAEHAKEVKEARQEGRNTQSDSPLPQWIADMVAESRAAGKREMAKEALEYWMTLRPVPRPNTSVISIFFEWLAERADGERKMRSCLIVGCDLPEPHTHDGGTEKASRAGEQMQPASAGFDQALKELKDAYAEGLSTIVFWENVRVAHAAAVKRGDDWARRYRESLDDLSEQARHAEKAEREVAKSRTTGKREAFGDVIQNVRNGLTGDALMSWLEARAGEEAEG